jgi:hypothetical protein
MELVVSILLPLAQLPLMLIMYQIFDKSKIEAQDENE